MAPSKLIAHLGPVLDLGPLEGMTCHPVRRLRQGWRSGSLRIRLLVRPGMRLRFPSMVHRS
jgi:hypothetical protein